MLASNRFFGRQRLVVLALLFLLALTVRGFRAVQEPIINPDAIRFIEQARMMASDPVGAMRSESYHPLHAGASLAVHGVVKGFFAEDRRAWLAAVKVVGVVAGAVVAMEIVLLGRLLGASFGYAVAAGVVWIFGRRTSYFGADGISDMLFLSLFGGAMIAGLHGLRFRRKWVGLFFVAGVLAGAGYLARPEALFAVLPLGVGILRSMCKRGLIAGQAVTEPRSHETHEDAGRDLTTETQRHGERERTVVRGVAAGLLLCVGTATCVVPYMVATGSLSHKEAKLVTSGEAPAREAVPISVAAAPEKVQREVWETFGFAPYLIVGVTFLASVVVARRWWVRRRLRLPLTLWIGLWIVLMGFVAHRLGYLDGRHTLIAVFPLHAVLAVAFFAVARSARYFVGRGHPAWPGVIGGAVVVLAVLPGVCLLSVPPRNDQRFILAAADWVKTHTPAETVVCDYEQLVGYYSGRAFGRWMGTPGEPRLEELPVAAGDRVMLAFRYPRGEKIEESIGGYRMVASFGGVGCDTLALYESPRSGMSDISGP